MVANHTSGAMLGVFALVFAAHGQAEFQGIGQLPGYRSGTEAIGLSADGGVVVGTAFGFDGTLGAISEAVTWSQGTLTGLGRDPGTQGNSAWTISGDGAMVYGQRFIAGAGVSVRWVHGRREDFPGPVTEWFAAAASHDGAVLAGPGWAFRDGQWWELYFDRSATGVGVTADGVVLCGYLPILPHGSAFQLVLPDGSRLVPPYPVSGYPVEPRMAGISPDGAAAFNSSFLWRRGNPIVHNLQCGNIRGASDQGRFAVGRLDLFNSRKAFIWDQAVGFRSLDCLLEQLGVSLGGWTLTEAVAVSSDGQVVAGNGINPDGIKEAWVARVPRLIMGANFDPHCDLNIFDFLAYQNAFAAMDPRADLDGNSSLDVFDFLLFQNLFAAGCR